MAFTVLRSLLLLLSLVYYISCAPVKERAVLERALKHYHEELRTSQTTIDMDGIDWNMFGIDPNNLLFDDYKVTATGLSAAIAYDRQDGIYVGDHLSRTRKESPNDHIAVLVRNFIAHPDRPKLRFLAITNIVQSKTKEFLTQFASDGVFSKTSKSWDALLGTPIGQIGSEVGTPFQVYVGAIQNSRGSSQKGGPTMVFIYDRTFKGKLTAIGGMAGQPSEQMGIAPAGGALSSSAGVLEYERQQKQKAAAARKKQKAAAEQKKKQKEEAGCCVVS